MKSDAADLVTIASEAGRRGLPVRGGLLLVQVRPGRPDRRTRPRAARAGRALHQRLSGRRRHRFRDGPRPHTGHAAAGGHDAARGRRRRGAVRAHAAAQRIGSWRSRSGRSPKHRGADATGTELRWGILSTADIGRTKVDSRHPARRVARASWRLRRATANAPLQVAAELGHRAQPLLVRGAARRSGR